MKRMAYSGTYKIQPDDFLVFDGDTDSVITERELLEEQKMSDSLHVRLEQAIRDRNKINEEVERLEKRIKEDEKIPMVRSAIWVESENRIIIRITKNMKKSIMEYSHSNVFLFDKEGCLCNHYPIEDDIQNMDCYMNVETLFEGELE